MALARNLKRGPKKSFKFKFPKLKKKGILVLIFIILVFSVYGFSNLKKISSFEKKEVKYESTGDRPLPQKIVFWIAADGGLYHREEPGSKAKILKIIPNGTQLEAIEVKEDWYKVTYLETTGWVNKSYTTTIPPAEDKTKDWNNFSNKKIGYSLRFPKEWVVQDYGENPASGALSYVAFGVQLPAQIDPIKLPPVIVKVVGTSKDTVEATYKGYSGSLSETVTVSGVAATKYTYTASSGIQMTAFVVGKGTQTYIIEESGGFTEELANIVNSFNLP